MWLLKLCSLYDRPSRWSIRTRMASYPRMTSEPLSILLVISYQLTRISLNIVRLGRLCTDTELESMIKEAPGPINFTMFLTIFGDRTQGKIVLFYRWYWILNWIWMPGTDEEDVILNAFAQYDEGNGLCSEEKLVKLDIIKSIVANNSWSSIAWGMLWSHGERSSAPPR